MLRPLTVANQSSGVQKTVCAAQPSAEGKHFLHLYYIGLRYFGSPDHGLTTVLSYGGTVRSIKQNNIQ
jgi:hypothetical protein